VAFDQNLNGFGGIIALKSNKDNKTPIDVIRVRSLSNSGYS